jgi:hypothetical protein
VAGFQVSLPGRFWVSANTTHQGYRLAFDSNLSNYYPNRGLKVFKPRGKFLEIIANYRGEYADESAVFVSPVYFLDLSESIRAFLEWPRRAVPDSARYIPYNDPIGGTPAVGVCLAGKNGGGAINCRLNLEKTIKECGFDVVDMIPLRRQNLEFKLPILEITGEWLVTKPTSDAFL